jgi:acyl-coenzyme A synthetase/AMP-(fatty) acid ligase
LELTYAQLNELVEMAAGRLLAELRQTAAGQTAAVQAPAPVCVAAAPNLETVVLFWAAQRVGCPFVVIDPSWSLARIAEFMQQQAFTLLFADFEIPPEVNLPDTTTVVLFESDSAPSRQLLRFEQWLEPEEVMALPMTLPMTMPDPKSTAVILFTSGTTGQPKGVELSHQTVWQSSINVAHYFQWRPDDVYLSLGNYATISGLRNALICTAVVGCKFLIPGAVARSSVLEAVAVLGNYGATLMGVVPAFVSRLAALAQRLDKTLFARIRFFMSAGANLQPQAARAVEDQLGVPVYNYYGLTETCGACIFVPANTHNEGVNCIGEPVDTIAQIVTEDDRVIVDDEPGELRLYSGNLMKGYLDESLASHQMMRDGWLYTGDICRWLPNGLLELKGRKRDVIKSVAGTLVYVNEVEHCLLAQADINELTVVSYIDDYGDERLVCFVIAPPDMIADSLLAQFNDLLRATLSQHHQLSRVIAVDGFPRGANEKIQRNALIGRHLNILRENR